ncbi:hypothetical protein B0H65DRAFT_442953 [Neurospora tetraspora]|uniref:Uncharacterized protein n=1 Tax=Neurospora tetraspora TaxID=94610 RepID=A0AAE0JFW2_9PEZI|nr:hypothetical protein B0H65DRAFT_442953 [Neurospora tetraspora]
MTANNRNQPSEDGHAQPASAGPAPVGTQFSTLAQALMPTLLDAVLQEPTRTGASVSDQALRTAVLNPSILSNAITAVMPEALEIVLAGVTAAIGPAYAPNEADIEYLKDHISFWYQRKILLQQIASSTAN